MMLRLAAWTSLSLASMVAADPCECLNWKHLYETNRVLLGEGKEADLGDLGVEFDFLAHMPLYLGEAHYRAFFNTYNIDGPYCVNYGNHQYGKSQGLQASQWCYVSSACKDLNGGYKIPDKKSFPTWIPDWLNKLTRGYLFNFVKDNFHTQTVIPRDVSWKICKKGVDKLSIDVEPLEWVEMGMKQNAKVTEFARLAFPHVRGVHEAGPLWQDVRDAFGSGDTSDLPDIVAEAMKDKVPIIIDTDSHKHDQSIRIIKGNELTKVNSNCGHHEEGCMADRHKVFQGNPIGKGKKEEL